MVQDIQIPLFIIEEVKHKAIYMDNGSLLFEIDSKKKKNYDSLVEDRTSIAYIINNYFYLWYKVRSCVSSFFLDLTLCL